MPEEALSELSARGADVAELMRLSSLADGAKELQAAPFEPFVRILFGMGEPLGEGSLAGFGSDADGAEGGGDSLLESSAAPHAQDGEMRSALATLGLPDAGVDRATAKKAYFEAALKCHPDTEGGDAAKFTKLTSAYEAVCARFPDHNFEPRRACRYAEIARRRSEIAATTQPIISRFGTSLAICSLSLARSPRRSSSRARRRPR